MPGSILNRLNQYWYQVKLVLVERLMTNETFQKWRIGEEVEGMEKDKGKDDLLRQ